MTKDSHKHIDPPVLSDLAPYLPKLPPFIARKQAKWFLGGIVSPSKLANDDSAGNGPRMRLKIGDKVAYPTEFLLEYLEKLGVTTIVPPNF